MILVKNWTFFMLFSFGQGNVFYKKSIFKWSQNWKILEWFFLDKIVKGNVFGNFSYDLQPSLDYKLVICERWKN